MSGQEQPKTDEQLENVSGGLSDRFQGARDQTINRLSYG
jgi:hypothetical protein